MVKKNRVLNDKVELRIFIIIDLLDLIEDVDKERLNAKSL
jgi:hypothetical protein